MKNHFDFKDLMTFGLFLLEQASPYNGNQGIYQEMAGTLFINNYLTREPGRLPFVMPERQEGETI